MEEIIKRGILRKPKDPVLIVEDSEEFQILLESFCSEMGLSTVIAENGEVAYSLIEKQSFSIYIVDLLMPVMDGAAFISLLKKKSPNAVIIVQSSLDSSNTIIEIMKLGVFDYVIKPIEPDLFEATIRKALEHKYMQDIEIYQSLNSGKKIQSQMDWLNYKEVRRMTNKDYAGIKSIHNLKKLISQGAGVGTIISMLDLLKNTLEAKDETYIVKKDILDLVFENNEYLRKQMNGLQEVTKILDENVTLEMSNAVTLVENLPRILSSIDACMHRKKLKIIYPELSGNYAFFINSEKLFLAIEELAVNAYKYSVPGTSINIFCHMSEGYFWISFLNMVNEEDIIKPEQEKLVLEPFFSLLPSDETIADVEKFGMGLGLTVVDNIVRKHKGSFLIRTVKDLTRTEQKNCILAEILLPCVAEE